jgi:hypothetical protein
MISKRMVLQKLEPFANFKKVLIEDQNTSDIIQGILDNHNNYEKEYDKISEMFIGDNEVETGKNIFKFLKDNVPYYVEPIEKQTLRSPSAILSMKGNNGQVLGADCKSYSSFILGVYDSLNRKGIFKVPIAYRFASYRYDTREPQHVFAVLYPNTKNEVWIDPVLNKFDQRKEPVFIKDKKIKMALIAMSGTSSQGSATLQEMQDYRDKLVSLKNKYLNSGVITPGSQEENQYLMAIEKVTRAIQFASISGVPNVNGIFDFGDSIDESVVTTNNSGSYESGKINWNKVFGKLIDTGTSFVDTKAKQNSGGGGGSFPEFVPISKNININNILLIAGAGIALFLILRKK